jgi:hypothetical protein
MATISKPQSITSHWSMMGKEDRELRQCTVNEGSLTPKCITKPQTVTYTDFLYNKTNQIHKFPKFTPAWNSTCFGQFLCPSSGVYSLYTRQWCMSYRFVESFRAAPGWNCSSTLVLLESCVYSACMTHIISECTVKKLLMMDRRTAQNM